MTTLTSDIGIEPRNDCSLSITSDHVFQRTATSSHAKETLVPPKADSVILRALLHDLTPTFKQIPWSLH